FDTPLEETLPVEMTVRDPDRFPPMSIVVVIDKSGSMAAEEDGVQKIRLAGEAAARVAELINDADEITVIAFDDRPADVIGPLPGSERGTVIDRVIRLQAGGGGIYVHESLRAALDVLKESDRTVRHVLLLADGSDAERQGGVRELIEEEFVPRGITLSVVAIGEGQDVPFLEEIARLGGGRFYFTGRAADLPTIFAQETQLAMRSYIVEEPFYPRQVGSSPMLEGIEAVPRLLGYVATTPKAAAQVVLTTHQDDPLLAAWQYGLGRAVAWTSDATGRWAAPWVGWEGFGRFWAQVVRWTLAQRADLPVEVQVSLEGKTARVVVDALDETGDFVNGMEGSVRIVGPEGETAEVDLAQVAPGRYEGTFEPWAEGVYLLRLDGQLPDGGAVGTTTGWALGYSPEYAALEPDPEAVARLAEAGGGRVLTEPAEVFTHDLRGEGVPRDLWPLLLTLATLLWPVDIALRRLALGRRDLERMWNWLAHRLPRRRSRPAAEAPSPVARLLRVKERTRRQPPSVAASPPTEESPPTAPPPPQPKPSSPAPKRPTPPPPSPEPETLAERLLRRKRERDGKDAG
ncbi:MAG TPA: VWA domain-containing protein, partial [Chloroflexi bacterium]|nr:VWA domain-containing protein [Chloroflexota bacterium]